MTNLRRINLMNLSLSGEFPDMFGSFHELTHWNSFGNNITGWLPPSVKYIAERREHFMFAVDDEQLMMEADYHCRAFSNFGERTHNERITYTLQSECAARARTPNAFGVRRRAALSRAADRIAHCGAGCQPAKTASRRSSATSGAT